jgi:osmotically-inducible protein OsmY
MSSHQNDLKSQVASILLTASDLGRALIELEDQDGTVTLKGRVESEQDRLTIETLTQEQEGVKQVINRLEVISS